jgi:hypothetical protein
MGYYANITHCAIHIPASLFPTICNHILTSGFIRPENMGGGAYGGPDDGKRWFSWCDMDQLESALKSNDFLAVLECFRFETSINDNGALDDIWFDGKMGDESRLFDCIAAVIPGTHRIDWRGEDGAQWRWLIRDNELRTLDGTTTFPGDDE